MANRIAFLSLAWLSACNLLGTEAVLPVDGDDRCLGAKGSFEMLFTADSAPTRLIVVARNPSFEYVVFNECESLNSENAALYTVSSDRKNLRVLETATPPKEGETLEIRSLSSCGNADRVLLDSVLQQSFEIDDLVGSFYATADNCSHNVSLSIPFSN